MVLAAQHMGFEARAVLGHYVRVRHLALHQPRFGAALGAQRFVTALEDPVQRLPWGQHGPALGQGLANGGQLRVGLVGGWQKAGEHEHGRVGVQRPLLAAGVAAPTAVEDALRIGGQGHGGDGAEQGLHRGSGMERSCPRQGAARVQANGWIEWLGATTPPAWGGWVLYKNGRQRNANKRR